MTAAELLRSDSAKRVHIADTYLATFGRAITPAQRTSYMVLANRGYGREAILVAIVADSVSEV